MDMKAKIDKKLCKHCDYGDTEHQLNGEAVCISKINKGNCRFDK
jgi:hypothetical protein